MTIPKDPYEALRRIAAHSERHRNDDPYPGGPHFAEYAYEVAMEVLGEDKPRPGEEASRGE